MILLFGGLRLKEPVQLFCRVYKSESNGWHFRLTYRKSTVRAADQLQSSAVCSAFVFYTEAFCYFQEANLFHYIFLKT